MAKATKTQKFSVFLKFTKRPHFALIPRATFKVIRSKKSKFIGRSKFLAAQFVFISLKVQQMLTCLC